MQKSLSLFFKCRKIVFFTIKISFQVNNFGFIDLTRELLSGKYGNIYPIFFVIIAVFINLYIIGTNKSNSQEKEIKAIQEAYNVSTDRMEEEYQNAK